MAVSDEIPEVPEPWPADVADEDGELAGDDDDPPGEDDGDGLGEAEIGGGDECGDGDGDSVLIFVGFGRGVEDLWVGAGVG